MSQPGTAQETPEIFIFFIAHMFHMLGEEDGNEPWSVPIQ